MFLLLSLACSPAGDDTAAGTADLTDSTTAGTDTVTETETTPDEAPAWGEVFTLLDRACGECHYSPYLGQFIERDSATTTHSLLLTAEPHSDRRARYVVPGNLEDSLVLQKLQPEPEEGEQMPPESEDQDPLTAAEVELLSAWVAGGAWD